MGSDVDGEVIGAEFKGYTLRITGGNDQQGFTMKQGILVNGRVKILMKNSKSLRSFYAIMLLHSQFILKMLIIFLVINQVLNILF